jgi:hypothetical protein
MKTIYLGYVSGNQHTNPPIKKYLANLIQILVTICMLIILIHFIIQSVQNINQDQDIIIVMLGFVAYMSYRYTRPPRLQIDSQCWFTYIGRIEYYSVQLKENHYFAITNNKMILHDHNKTVVSIPCSDFESVNLMSFAAIINQAIETKDFKTALSSEGHKIPGFTYRIFQSQNAEKICQQNRLETKLFEQWTPIFMLIVVLMGILFRSLQ